VSDLREVLRQHADAVEDLHHHERVRSVRGRVAAVRRRRVLAGAAALLLVAGGVAGGLAWPRDRTATPADRPSHMVGHAVPKTTTSWGATYSYTKGYVGTGHLTVQLPTGGQDVLVRVASAKDDGQLVVTERGSAWVLPAGDFGTFRRIDGDAGTVTVDARGDTGDLALAVYSLAKRAPGYTRDGITFPDEVEHRALLGAFISDPGQDHGSVRLDRIDWTGSAPTVQVRTLCVGAPKGAKVAVDLGDGPLEVGCETGAPTPSDAAHASGAVTFRAPGREMTATIDLVDHTGKRIPVPAGGRIGAAVYGFVGPDRGSAGLMGTIDQDGHTWQLQGTVEISRQVERWRRVPIDVPQVCTGRHCYAQPVLVGYGSTGGSKGYVEARVPGQDPARNSAGGFGYAELATGDPDAAVSVRGTGLAPSTTLVVGTYVLAD
jgi:hypothetical protein